MFGYISTVLTLLTGIFLWFFLRHFFNNFVLKLVEFVTAKEDIAIWYGLGLFVIIAIFEYNARKKRKKSLEQRLIE